MPYNTKPVAGEYVPYTIMYIDLVPNDTDVIQFLLLQAHDLKEQILRLSPERLSTPCAPGEWTVKEIIGHITDTERVMSFRALHAARQDENELPGFDQDAYVAVSHANQRNTIELLEEFAAVRSSSITLLQSFPHETFHNTAKISGHQVSVRALAYVIAGHCRHHMLSIAENYAS
jgi:DinB superfamily